jgi:hypothetical protein
VAYSPASRLAGLSKLGRVINAHARRLQIQEHLTAAIATTIGSRTRAEGALVVMEAEHTCMTLRGVRKEGSRLLTYAATGTWTKTPPHGARSSTCSLPGANRPARPREICGSRVSRPVLFVAAVAGAAGPTPADDAIRKAALAANRRRPADPRGAGSRAPVDADVERAVPARGSRDLDIRSGRTRTPASSAVIAEGAPKRSLAYDLPPSRWPRSAPRRPPSKSAPRWSRRSERRGHALRSRTAARGACGSARPGNRAALAPLLAKLRDAGRKGSGSRTNRRRPRRGVAVRLVDAAWNSKLTTATRVLAIPSGGALISVQGKTYRGVVELRVDGSGRLRAIDWVEMEHTCRESCLELGPRSVPQLEALKRRRWRRVTYAIANLGQFEDDGYDICFLAALAGLRRCRGRATRFRPRDSETRGEVAVTTARRLPRL